MLLGHNVTGDVLLEDFVMPRNLEEDSFILSTIWNTGTKTGQTIKVTVPSKSYWKLVENPSELLKKHDDEDKALAFHEKTLKKMTEVDGYCGSDYDTRDDAEKDKRVQ